MRRARDDLGVLHSVTPASLSPDAPYPMLIPTMGAEPLFIQDIPEKGAAISSTPRNPGATSSLHFGTDTCGSDVLAPQIDKPVHRSNHDPAADDIADRDRHEVADDEIAPGQGGKIFCGLVDRGPEGVRRADLDEQGDRQIVDVGDAVLKPGGDERADRGNDHEYLFQRGARA